MIKIEVQVKDYAWIAKLSVEIKGKIHKKEIKGIFEDKKEIKEIIFSNLKSTKDLYFFTNDKDLEKIFKDLNYPTEVIDLNFDFSEIIEHKETEDPTVPEFLDKSFEEICIYETKELNQIALSTYFVKAYMFFRENEDKIKEIKVLKELKSKGIYGQETLIEDILQVIEESLSN